MCNICYLPAGVEVPETEIYNAGTWNTDGYGWAVAAEIGTMLTGRYLDLDTALTTFAATRKAFPNVPAMFHSRLATHGTVSLSNVHPFTVGKYAAVAHNGILPTKFQPQRGSINAHMSDTAIMARFWLAGRAQTAGVWTRKERNRIGRIIGKGNKLAILSVSPFLPEPRGYLINGGQGTWDSVTGAWFSNHDYMYQWTPKNSKGSLAWLWADDEWSGGYEVGRKSDPSPYDRCPNCGHSEQLDSISGVCLYCDFCLDCLFPLRECMCHYPGDSFKTDEDRTAEADAEDMPIEIRMTELGGES